MKKLSFLFAVVLFFAACNNNTPEQKFTEIQGIDSSHKPGDNFFQYANSKWYDSAQIPSSQSGVGAYMFMNYPQRLRLQNILDSISKAGNTAGSIEQKVGDYYASGMDTATVNKRGYDPLKPILASILAWAIEPRISKGASNRSNSLSFPTVNFSTNLEVSVLSLLHNFILKGFR